MKRILAALFLMASVISCMTESQDMNVNEIQRNIETSLSVGDSFDKIEQFMKKNNMMYDFDYHESRFQARMSAGQQDTDNIAIHIYVDIDGRFVRAHVERVYTYL